MSRGSMRGSGTAYRVSAGTLSILLLSGGAAQALSAVELMGAAKTAESVTAKKAAGGGKGHTPVDICHITGNGKFVALTVDDDGAFSGHAGHVGDLLPAPGACPADGPVTGGGTDGSKESDEKSDEKEPGKGSGDKAPGRGHTPVDICHITGNGKFVALTVDDDGAFSGHAGHVGDLLPAPGPCPADVPANGGEGPVGEQPVETPGNGVELPGTGGGTPVDETPGGAVDIPGGELPGGELPGDGAPEEEVVVETPGDNQVPVEETPVEEIPEEETPVDEVPVTTPEVEDDVTVDDDAPALPDEIAGVESERKDREDRDRGAEPADEIAGVEASAGKDVAAQSGSLPQTGAQGRLGGLAGLGAALLLAGAGVLTARRRVTATASAKHRTR